MNIMNKNWIAHPTVLEGESVKLMPLEHEHFEDLYIAASDEKLWEFTPLNCAKRETFDAAYESALVERTRGTQYPFVIVYKTTGEIIGSTRLMEIFPADEKLEIGWTWLAQKFWATEVNFECKLLLLTFCFETLKARRVQLKTDETNIRSRTAIQKIGAKFEGILRRDKIKENGVSRNTAYFSILDDEWHAARENISKKLEQRRKEKL